MSEFKIIYGKKSIRYDHFRDYEFRSCRAINVRLMGVTALKVIWSGKSNKRDRFYQIIHLDYSEYGVDEYREFECIPGDSSYSEKKHEMTDLWNHFIGVTGGEVKDIEAPVMMRLIADALPLAGKDVKREYDSGENREFRDYALFRIGYMMDALRAEGFSEDDCSSKKAIMALMPQKLGTYETINYFVMRLVDHDFAAASALSSIRIRDLRTIDLTEPGIQTLMKCNIERSSRKDHPASDGSSYPYLCRATTLAGNNYYHLTFIIWLSGSILTGDPVVTEVRTGSVLKLSDYEAAMQLARSEYITVFECEDKVLEGFNASYIGPLTEAEAQDTPNGRMYTVYKRNNSHVDSREYRLEGDVMGHALLSLGGELVLMSHSLSDITRLDDATVYSLYSPHLTARGRYRIDTPVFQTLCMVPGASFEDLVEPGDEQ